MSDRDRPAWAEALERRLLEQGEAMERRIDERAEAMERRLDERAEAMERRFDERAEAMERRLDDRAKAMEHRIDERAEAMEHRIDERAEAMEHRIISEVAKALADTEHRLRSTMDERFAGMHDDITVCLAAIEDRDRRHDSVVSDLRSMRETMGHLHRRLRALELRVGGGGQAGPEAA
jgi:DNA anti-recombination protein RmuC